MFSIWFSMFWWHWYGSRLNTLFQEVILSITSWSSGMHPDLQCLSFWEVLGSIPSKPIWVGRPQVTWQWPHWHIPCHLSKIWSVSKGFTSLGDLQWTGWDPVAVFLSFLVFLWLSIQICTNQACFPLLYILSCFLSLYSPSVFGLINHVWSLLILCNYFLGYSGVCGLFYQKQWWFSSSKSITSRHKHSKSSNRELW